MSVGSAPQRKIDGGSGRSALVKSVTGGFGLHPSAKTKKKVLITMAKKLKVTQTKSTIGRLANQKATIKALGIRKMNHSVVHDDNSSIRGMIDAVMHLVKVEEV